MLPAIFLIAWTSLSGGQPAPPPDDVRTLENALVAAMHAKDGDALERLLAPGFVLRASPRDIDRATWLKNALALCWGARSDVDEFQQRLTGDTVVVSFVLTFYSDPVSCQPAVLRSLITDVWTRQDGRWQLLVRHSGAATGAGVEDQYALVPERPPSFEARAELSFVATGGNASTQTLGFAGQTLNRHARGQTTTKAAFVRSEADDRENARSVALQARHGVRLSDRLELFARGGYLADRFAGLEHRVTTDGGLAWRVAGAPHALTVNVGLGATFETRLGAADEQFANASGGLTYRWTRGRFAELLANTEATANLEDGNDWRWAGDVGLTVNLNSILAVKTSYAARYVHEPVPGFERTDITASASLVLTYARRATR